MTVIPTQTAAQAPAVETPTPVVAVTWQDRLEEIEWEANCLTAAAADLIERADDLAFEAADESDDLQEAADDVSWAASEAMIEVGRRLDALRLAVDKAGDADTAST